VRTGLDPFRPADLHDQAATGEEPGHQLQREPHHTIQTGIDGYRVIAERDAAKRGVPLKKARFQYWDDEGNVSDAWWKAEPPAMIRATVQLGDDEPVVWDARFSEYVPLKDEYEDVTDENGVVVKVNGKKQTRKTGRRVPQGMWATRPTAQLEKCAEAGALRRACPEDLSNLYVDAEMQRDDPEPSQTTLVDDGAPTAARDWIAEAAVAEDAEALREIWRSSAARGEKSPSVMAAIRKRTAELREQEKAEGDTESGETIQPVSPEPLVSERAGEVVAEPDTAETLAAAAEAEAGYDVAQVQEVPDQSATVLPQGMHAPDGWGRPISEVGTICGLTADELGPGETAVVDRADAEEVTCPGCRASLGLEE
jgi:hypothetical protein